MIQSQRRCTAVLQLPLLHITRRGDRHTLHDHRVDVRIEDGDVDAALIRRAVQALAVEHAAGEPELFAMAVARHLTQRAGAGTVEVEVRSRGWERVAIGGRERGGDLTAPASLLRVARARREAGAETTAAGLRGLRLLSPGDAGEPLLEFQLDALWSYGWADVPLDTQWQQVRRALAEAYAERPAAEGVALAESLARSVLEVTPAVRDMQLTLLVTRFPAVDTDAFAIAGSGSLYGAADAARAQYEVRLVRDEVTELQ